ncbi:hypothetical protein [Pelosinus sp. sgz500959]|uniref:hypothetical protein n=1 Tax=Pelosinus sp. sgz500959 TaxID=3242472 RepID=UPI003672E0C2
MRVFLLLVIFISLSCGVVQATDNSMSITIPVFTRHFPHSNLGLNEHNRGFGLEYILRKDVALTTGLFNNSLRNDTFYVGVQYTPFRVLGLHAGVVVGLDLNGGYNSANPFKPVIGALHFATGNESPIGFNIDILPSGGYTNGDGVYGAAAVSMKYSF